MSCSVCSPAEWQLCRREAVWALQNLAVPAQVIKC